MWLWEGSRRSGEPGTPRAAQLRKGLEAELATREELVSTPAAAGLTTRMLGTTRERKDGMVDKEAVAALLLCGKETVTGWVEGSAVGPRTPTATGELLYITHPLLWG